ncbi:GDSL-type esterase/lipase family protein [Pontiellaceae bacterium B12219]|nr:GDSL-type esterase/lipase family protein [Pontiellaceae bacterium B12219]
MKIKLITSTLVMLLGGLVSADGATTDLGAIWCIGDSITQSNADGDGSSSPRKSLYDLLDAFGYTFSYTGHHTRNTDGLPSTGSTVADNLYHYHSGSSGYRVGEVGVDDAGDKVIAPNLATYWTTGRLAVVKPDIVLIMLGTNDADYKEGASERLRKLIQNIFDLPGAGDPAIYVASIPLTGRENNNEEFVIPFNAAIPGIVAEYQASPAIREIDVFGTPTKDAIDVPEFSSNVSVSNGTFYTQFTGSIGAQYQVEYSEDLSTNSWKVVSNISSLVSSPMGVEIAAINAAGFYRVIGLP